MSFLPPNPLRRGACPAVDRVAVLVFVCVTFLLLAHASSAAPTKVDAAVFENGDVQAQQKELVALGSQPGPEADRVLLTLFDRFLNKDLPPAVWLEFFEAVGKRSNPELKARLAEHRQKIAASRDPLVPYRECLEGGNADSGREIFTKKVEAACIRCHQVSGEGGHIGPDLTALQQVTDRLYILESIIDPNAVITAGFQNVLLTMKNGETVSGIASFESDDEVVIISVVDGKKHSYATAEIVDRKPLPSAMPPGFGLILGKHAIRDLVEFLATAKTNTD